MCIACAIVGRPELDISIALVLLKNVVKFGLKQIKQMI